MSDTIEDDMVMKWKIVPDEQAEKKTKQAASNMISLISDLAIIGKVAGEVLSKVWDGLQKTIQASLDGFDDVNLGLTVNVDPDDMMALKYAVTQSGGTNKDAMNMVQQMDKVIRSFNNPETGSEAMEDFIKKLAVKDIPDDVVSKIEDAIENEDTITALKELAETRNYLGDDFSNLMNDLKVSGLGFLEIDYQYEDWIEAWEQASRSIFDVNTEGLDSLEDGWGKIKTSMDMLAMSFGADLGPLIDLLGTSLFNLVDTLIKFKQNIEKSDGYKKMSKAATTILTGKTGLGEDSTLLERVDAYTAAYADYFVGLAELVTGKDLDKGKDSAGAIEFFKNSPTGKALNFLNSLGNNTGDKDGTGISTSQNSGNGSIISAESLAAMQKALLEAKDKLTDVNISEEDAEVLKAIQNMVDSNANYLNNSNGSMQDTSYTGSLVQTLITRYPEDTKRVEGADVVPNKAGDSYTINIDTVEVNADNKEEFVEDLNSKVDTGKFRGYIE